MSGADTYLTLPLSGVRAIEASDTGAKADAAKVFMSSGGTKSHTRDPFHRGRAAAGVGSLASDG